MTEEVPLRDYVERIFEEKQAAVEAALTSYKESITERTTTINDRLSRLDAFRAEFNSKQLELQSEMESLAERIDGRLAVMEAWRLRATGSFLVLVPLAGVVGAAVMRLILGK